MDVRIIQAAYPNPKRASGEGAHLSATFYCVGGALCAFYNLLGTLEDMFPGQCRLADGLLAMNPLLPAHKALYFAQMIIESNDKGQFEDAWRWADTALVYTPKED